MRWRWLRSAILSDGHTKCPGASRSIRSWGGSRFPQDQPRIRRACTWYYGFPADIAGGDYGRSTTFLSGLRPLIKVPSPQPTIQAGLNLVAATGGVVEVSTNGIFRETPVIRAAAETQIELRASR